MEKAATKAAAEKKAADLKAKKEAEKREAAAADPFGAFTPPKPAAPAPPKPAAPAAAPMDPFGAFTPPAPAAIGVSCRVYYQTELDGFLPSEEASQAPKPALKAAAAPKPRAPKKAEKKQGKAKVVEHPLHIYPPKRDHRQSEAAPAPAPTSRAAVPWKEPKRIGFEVAQAVRGPSPEPARFYSGITIYGHITLDSTPAGRGSIDRPSPDGVFLCDFFTQQFARFSCENARNSDSFLCK